ncbi:MAG: hypothetical protein M3174_04850 [Actinomycetota bacterium]|nr:hypothetical protein [Actinomycetota bacterium]
MNARAQRVFPLVLAVGLVGAAIGPVDAASPKTVRISVRSNETEGDLLSEGYIDNLSNDANIAAFKSDSSLVAGDSNGFGDIYVRNRTAGTTRRVSIASDGTEGNGLSYSPAISGNGRFVAFISAASTLVSDDGNDVDDVFVHDLQTERTRRVSIASNGEEGSESVGDQPDLSRSGRFVVFHTRSQLSPADDNADHDVYVRDRKTQSTRLLSVTSDGDPVNDGDSMYPQISEEGRFVVFQSDSEDLVAGNNGVTDIFLHDRRTGETRIVSTRPNGRLAAAASSYPQISGDGTIVTFDSGAQLVPGDNNAFRDIYMRNMDTGQTRLVTRDRNGGPTNEFSEYSSISPNGRMIGFYSQATDLVADDPPSAYSAYVYDRKTKRIVMLDRSSSGAPGDGLSYVTGVSGNGRFVLISTESALVGTDDNDVSDIYRRGPLY